MNKIKHAMSVIKVINNLNWPPKSIPKAMPGFSTKVILKILCNTGILWPGYIPLSFMFKGMISIPLTNIFESWSAITIKRETNRILTKLPYFQPGLNI